MTKNEVAEILSTKTGMKMSTAINAVEGIMEIMSETFSKGESIFLRGFGTYRVVVRKAKTGQDITRKKTIHIPERRTVKFIPSKTLKDKMK